MAKNTNFAGMFQGASAFNRDLSRWNTGRGTDFQGMFGSGRPVTGNGPPVMASNNAFKCPRCA